MNFTLLIGGESYSLAFTDELIRTGGRSDDAFVGLKSRRIQVCKDSPADVLRHAILAVMHHQSSNRQGGRL